MVTSTDLGVSPRTAGEDCHGGKLGDGSQGERASKGVGGRGIARQTLHKHKLLLRHDKKMRGYTIYDIYYDDYRDVRIFFAFEERFLRHSLRTGNCARTPDWSLSSSTVYNVVEVV